jgi:hypothetical protein
MSWIQHALRRNEWRPQRQVVALATLGLFVAIIIGALYLSQSASSAALGRELEVLIAERNNLEQQNEQLRADISSLRGVGRLLTRAAELGFVSADSRQIDYLVINGYNPNRSITVAPIVQEEEPLPAYDEPFLGWVQQQFESFAQQLENMQQEQP